MSHRDAVIVESLVNIANDTGNRMLERRMADTAVWYFNNRDRLPRDNLAARQDFTEKAVWIMLEIMALQQERIHDLERGGKSSHLYLPSGVIMNGKSYG